MQLLEKRLLSMELCFRGGVPGWKRNAISEDVELSMRVQIKTRKLVVYNSEMIAWKHVGKDLLSWSHIRDCSFGIGLSRMTKKQLFIENQLASLFFESNLLRQVFFKLIPNALVNWIPNRDAARHRLSVTLYTIFFLAAGYLYGTMTRKTPIL